ncbi:hypothetical protein MGAS10750_Spy0542 [Streptococcus pyogenes MGAS10750]|nr:hypothetical protein MGAS10750_Spy0542 [Streptococcus pyogenes MGAS10750]
MPSLEHIISPDTKSSKEAAVCLAKLASISMAKLRPERTLHVVFGRDSIKVAATLKGVPPRRSQRTKVSSSGIKARDNWSCTSAAVISAVKSIAVTFSCLPAINSKAETIPLAKCPCPITIIAIINKSPLVYRFTQKYCSAFKILCQYFFKKIFEKEKVNGCAKKESKMVFFVTI